MTVQNVNLEWQAQPVEARSMHHPNPSAIHHCNILKIISCACIMHSYYNNMFLIKSAFLLNSYADFN